MLNSSSSIIKPNFAHITHYFNTINKNESHYSISIYRCNHDYL